jgi:hypothetical protein
MTNTKCLNCDKELSDTFCSGCGQKADTHRITFKNFFYHDLLHGAFHIEKGMLFTAKESLLNPGKAALNYISGKRKRYYNVFLLILITIGVMLFVRHLDEVFGSHDSKIVVEKVFPNEASAKLDKIITQKIFIFLFVPIASINTFLLFRRKTLNLSEHFIISGMILLGILLIGTFANIMFNINYMTIQLNDMILSWLVTAIIVLYVGYGYFKTFRDKYSAFSLTYRILLFFALLCIEVTVLILVIFGFLTNWKFGKILLSPFN